MADSDKPEASTIIRISGDDALWGVAYQRYIRLWTNLARSSRLSEDDAKDIVHGVLSCILANGVHEFESLEHLRNYVCRAVLNRVVLHHQREVRKTSLLDVPSPSVSEPISALSLRNTSGREVLAEAIRRLKKKQFEIIKYRFYSGLTFSEISLLLGKPISTLKSREEAAMRNIRKELRKKGVL